MYLSSHTLQFSHLQLKFLVWYIVFGERQSLWADSVYLASRGIDCLYVFKDGCRANSLRKIETVSPSGVRAGLFICNIVNIRFSSETKGGFIRTLF